MDTFLLFAVWAFVGGLLFLFTASFESRKEWKYLHYGSTIGLWTAGVMAVIWYVGV